MGYVLKKVKIADWAPNHPFAHEQISFVPNQAPSSNNSLESPSKENSASPDPMLPAMNGLEDAMLQMASQYTGKPAQAQSQPKDSTTHPESGKA